MLRLTHIMPVPEALPRDHLHNHNPYCILCLYQAPYLETTCITIIPTAYYACTRSPTQRPQSLTQMVILTLVPTVIPTAVREDTSSPNPNPNSISKPNPNPNPNRSVKSHLAGLFCALILVLNLVPLTGRSAPAPNDLKVGVIANGTITLPEKSGSATINIEMDWNSEEIRFQAARSG